MTKPRKIPPEILAAISTEFACRHQVVPLQLTDDILKVGFVSPTMSNS